MKPLNLTFFLFSFLMCTFLKAQVEDYDVRHFTTDDGISNNVVHNITQDTKGFIWFGTEFGLNRFDGHEFKVFTKRKNGLASNLISNINEDAQGNLWIECNTINSSHFEKITLLSILNTNTDQAISFDEYFPDAPFSAHDIRILKSDQDRNIWIITKQGALYIYRTEFELIAENKIFGNARAIKILDRDNILLGLNNSNGNQIIKIDSRGKIHNRKTAKYKEIKHLGQLPNQSVWVYYSVSSVTYRMSTFDFDDDQPATFLDFSWKTPTYNSFNSYHKIDEKGNNQFWHTGINSLLVTNEKGELIYDLSEKIFGGLVGVAAHEIFFDRFENIWVSSNRGLFLLSPKNDLFRTALVQKNPKKSNFSIRGMEEFDERHILAATYKGFYLIDKITLDTSKLNVDLEELNTFERIYTTYGVNTLTIGDTILSCFHGNKFWIIDKLTLKIKPYRFKKKDIENHLFYKDDLNQIWAGTSDGIFLLDLEKKELNRSPLFNLDEEFAQVRINHIFERKNELLVGTEEGVFSMNHQGEILDYFEVLKSYQVNFIHQTSDGNYWLTTKGNGLIFWDRKNNETRQFSKEEGAAHDYIYSIYEDKFGFFWLPSNDGLMRLDPHDFSINTFHEKDGIAHREFNTHARLKTKDGKLYLGGLSGITIFHPKDFQLVEKKKIPIKIISAKKLESGENKFKEIDTNNEDLKEIYFSDSDRAINLKFALLDYSNSFQSQYAYKIDGYDNDWHYMEGNQLTINKLEYGEYQLNIKAQGSNGIWSKEILKLPLYVLKPFYLKWQFILLGLFALGAMIYGVFRWRFNHLEKRNLALENVVAERTQELAEANDVKDQFFAIIAHDMRGLVLSFKNISKKVNFLQRKGRQKEVDSFLEGIDKSAESLSNLLDNLLNWALVEKGVFPHQPESFNLEKVVVENIKLFTQLSRIKEIKLSYDVHETINLFADRNAVSTIIRNLVNNAIKFSSAGDEVMIKSYPKDGKIQIQVEDSGTGIASEKLENIFKLNSKKTKQGTIGEQGTGLGLLLCKELVALNKGEIYIKSEEGIGTSVLVNFPNAA